MSYIYLYTGKQNYYLQKEWDGTVWRARGTQKESISFQKLLRSRLKSERGTKEKRPSNEKERKRV